MPDEDPHARSIDDQSSLAGEESRRRDGPSAPGRESTAAEGAACATETAPKGRGLEQDLPCEPRTTFAARTSEGADPASGLREAVASLKREWGDAFELNLHLAQRAVDHYGDADLKTELNKSGLGNSPSLIKVFYQIGRGLIEDELIGETGEPSAGDGDRRDERTADRNDHFEPTTIQPDPSTSLGQSVFPLPPYQRRPIPSDREMTLFEVARCLCGEWIEAWQDVCSYDFWSSSDEYIWAKKEVEKVFPGRLSKAEVDAELPHVIRRRQLEMKFRKSLLQREITAELKHALKMGVFEVNGVGPAPSFEVRPLSPRLLHNLEIELCEGTEKVLVSYEGFKWTSVCVILRREKAQPFTNGGRSGATAEQNRLNASPSSSLPTDEESADDVFRPARRARPKRDRIVGLLIQAERDQRLTLGQIARGTSESLSTEKIRQEVQEIGKIPSRGTIENACTDVVKLLVKNDK